MFSGDYGLLDDMTNIQQELRSVLQKERRTVAQADADPDSHGSGRTAHGSTDNVTETGWRDIFRRRTLTGANWRHGRHVHREIALPDMDGQPWLKRYVGPAGVFLMQRRTHRSLLVRPRGDGDVMVQELRALHALSSGGITPESTVYMSDHLLVVRSNRGWPYPNHVLCVWHIGDACSTRAVPIRPEEDIEQLDGRWALLWRRLSEPTVMAHGDADAECASAKDVLSVCDIATGQRCCGELQVATGQSVHIQAAMPTFVDLYTCGAKDGMILWQLHRFQRNAEPLLLRSGRLNIQSYPWPGVVHPTVPGVDETLRYQQEMPAQRVLNVNRMDPRSIRLDHHHVLLRIPLPNQHWSVIAWHDLDGDTTAYTSGNSCDDILFPATPTIVSWDARIALCRAAGDTFVSLTHAHSCQREVIRLRDGKCVGKHPWPIELHVNQALGTVGLKHGCLEHQPQSLVDMLTGKTILDLGLPQSVRGATFAMPTYITQLRRDGHVLTILDFGAK
ncbi:hypothetical protein THASP1DRAFT_28253 [Thamnocephalis sphaerospora]|uniref:Uncharacterized protein n=1 Tax=Thamnocephalis sphaerospora TaxID=78915 RepID=A0A4P9XUP9_9FUNG|nr:hypothetical protein THASP1DRAFT_28253 [Thamnocephalis sphaerospora]|eukprot:RKP09964.1 hypothetical protein THASP1DRAFT_28253 [Thamnocephalis sphaerospora]